MTLPERSAALVMAPRAGRVGFAPIGGGDFLSLVFRHARSAESGAITSQYEAELRANEPKVGAIVFQGCDATLGGASFGIVPLPREGGVSLRIDVLLTLPAFRGLGVAGLLFCELVEMAHRTHGPALRHLSVLAMHPAVTRLSQELGLELKGNEKTPLYGLSLSAVERTALLDRCTELSTRRMAKLRSHCVQCQAHSWIRPWCRPSPELTR